MAPPDGFWGTAIARVCVLGVSLESRASAERSLQVQAGEPLDPTRVREDLALLYGLGRFDDVAAYGQATARGLLLLYAVRERPRLREVVFVGDDRGVAAELVANSLNPDAPLDIRRVHAITRLVREEYVNQGHSECRVDHAALALPTGDVRLRITVDAGPQRRVAAVNFRGQGKALEAERREVHSLLAGRPLVRARVEAARERLLAAYRSRGMLDARVMVEEGGAADGALPLTFVIDEGRVYTFAALHTTGIAAAIEAQLLAEVVQARAGQAYARSAVADDVARLKLYYEARGERVEVTPRTVRDAARATIELSFAVEKHPDR
ncbi:MAG: hypothetical protein IPO88_08600 [Nannocystis sp.]|uniref:POTRA domain-containing protein n=1 Tax=Nannocystis sp. TaxID=1962667 RepID=UPI0024219B6B|nr:POTRA domain-containing protein [Nannocystis sp.]MBK9753552.1 hypothetical protein [Nannocystis sp.]